MPTWIDPMKAVLTAHVPSETKGWAFEIKWDGIRTLAFHDGKSMRLLSRNALDATFRYPELAELGRALGRRTAILDGEIIALNEKGDPSFPELQKRMNVTTKIAVERAAREVEISYVLFDVLYLDGRNLRDDPFTTRRQKLETLASLLPPACRLSPVRVGGHKQGMDMLAAARDRGLEGIMAKRTDSLYETGRRSSSWLKIKIIQRQELVIGGWVPQMSLDGKLKPDQIGAILLGYHDKPGGEVLHFAGAVGTGFDNQASREMVKRLRPLHIQSSPFHELTEFRRFRAAVQWVRPEVVVEIEYRRWPEGALMHQAAFKGVREDKPAKDVVRELPADV
jgi:bifunctional non-homologous end joining protein LigD